MQERYRKIKGDVSKLYSLTYWDFEILDCQKNISFTSNGHSSDEWNLYTIKVPEEVEDIESFFYCLCSNCGGAFLSIPEKYQTYDLCLVAVSQDGTILKHLPNKFLTEEIVETAVKQNGKALRNVPKEMRTKKVCDMAFASNVLALRYMPKEFITDDMYITGVHERKNLLSMMPDNLKTFEICKEAVLDDARNLKFVPDCHVVQIWQEVVLPNSKRKIPIIDEKDLKLKKMKMEKYFGPSYYWGERQRLWYETQQRVYRIKQEEKKNRAKKILERTENEELLNCVLLQTKEIEKLNQKEELLLQKLKEIQDTRREIEANISLKLGEIKHGRKE